MISDQYEGSFIRNLIHFDVNGNWTILKGACYYCECKFKAYNALDVHTGELYVIKEIFAPTNKKENVEDHLNKLIRLEHDNLFEFKSFKYEPEADNKLKFYILQKFDFGFTNISLFSKKNIPVNNDALKHFAKGILSAIHYLHVNGIKDISIDETSILIDDNGNVKLYSFGMEELMYDEIIKNIEIDFNYNIISLFAIVMLAMHTGKPMDKACVPTTSPRIFQEFINECNTTKGYDQFVIEKLLNHLFMEDKCSILTYIPLQERPFDDSFKYEFDRKVSRVDIDYEKLELLGKGGFGKVFKVKDRYDGKYYALKEIKLMTNNERQIKKTLREVELWAELQHENIVRYFHSWTDFIDPEDESDPDSGSDNFNGSLQLRLCSLESTSTGVTYYSHDNNDSDGECDVDDGNMRDSSICFQEDSKIEANSECNPSIANLRNILYIKMEFCESNTLKSAIDQYLYLDRKRIWKFFKEIVEGLRYIHDKGIIHRDLKPINIFLDHQDHVKIGDFGFATTNLKYSRNLDIERDFSNENSGSYTNRVGTTFYLAPELQSSAYTICNQKIDMYSLGIIFFEMCYKPMNTGQERTLILKNLRSIKICMPGDSCNMSPEQRAIITKLLNHNPEQRPNCQELLNSNLIPSFEEEEQKMQIIRKVIDSPESRINKYLFEYLFSPRNDIKYTKRVSYININQLETIIRIVSDIFRKYGGKHFDVGTTSVQTACQHRCGQCLKLVNEQGSNIVLPCNDRKFFAQYVLSKNTSTWLRRYSVQKIPGFTCNKYKCVFDIITNVDLRKYKNFLPEAEILHILHDIKSSFVGLDSNNFNLRVNHSLLIHAILDECDISSHPDCGVIVLISTFVPKGNHRKQMLLQYMNPTMCEKYVKMLESCYILNDFDISLILKNFKVTHRSAIEKIKKAITELRSICELAQQLGVVGNIVLDPSCMLHNYERYSGILTELDYKPKRSGIIPIASGGRYDQYLNSISDTCNTRNKKYGVGIFVYPQALLSLMQTEKSVRSGEVIVCSYSRSIHKKIIETLKNLRDANISCSFVKMQNKKHKNRFCSKNNILCCILMNNKTIKNNKISITQQCKTNITEYTIEIEDVVAAVETILYGHPEKLTITKPVYCEVPLLFRTSPDLSYNQQFKCKIKILQLLKNEGVKVNSIIFVTNTAKAVIEDFVFCYETYKVSTVRENWLRTIFRDLDEFRHSIDYAKCQVIFVNILSDGSGNTETIYRMQI